MEQLLDIAKFDSYKRRQPSGSEEGERGDCRCPYGDTYSSFANCYGGVIILGGRAGSGVPDFLPCGRRKDGKNPKSRKN